MDKTDRLYCSICITSNKPLTNKQWDKIHAALTEAFENAIAESPKLTEQIGNVLLDNPCGDGREICP